MLDAAFIDNFHFLRPWWLLAGVPALAAAFYMMRASYPLHQWTGFIAPHLLPHLVSGIGLAKWIRPSTLLILVALLSSIAMAGPTWRQSVSPFIQDQAPLIFVVDLSRSMDQSDIAPTRLERAKQKMRDILAARESVLAAVVVYAGSAHVASPLTSDTGVLLNLVEALSTQAMPRRGKYVEKSLPKMARLFAPTSLPGTVILLTDAVSKPSALKVQSFCTTSPTDQHQWIVYGIGRASTGIGTTGTDHPPNGQLSLPFERASLQNLADVCSGQYVEVSLENTDVKLITSQIQSHFENAGGEERPWIDMGYYLLFPIALLTLLWFRRGWALHWVILATFITPLAVPQAAHADGGSSAIFWDLWLSPDQQGYWAYKQVDYVQAAHHFEDPMWKGTAYYLAEQFDNAIEVFLRIGTLDARFNLGNAYAQNQQYLEAVRTYDEVLALNVDHLGAVKNKEIVQRLIDEINAMSASQQSNPGESEESTQLGEGPQRAQGAEREVVATRDRENFTADQILNDPAKNEIWMKQVQPDPSQFLSFKFHRQLAMDEEAP
ncbi:MAG: VWA domain-containing protein [Parvibaculaceae bacterium]|nr:VWA domain-containing protein [Parvibaculaceae bacterium]